MLSPEFSTIPQELIDRSRWLVWRGAKVPYCSTSPAMKASSTDPDTWSSFEQAQTAYEEGGFSGIGFALNNDGIVGVDLDKCVVNLKPEAAAIGILDELGCAYVEYSPSGNGLRAFGYGASIKGTRGKINGINVELYSGGRYLTVTGHVLRNGPIDQLSGFVEMAQAIKSPVASQTHETHREYRDDRSHISVVSVLSVGDAITRTTPSDHGDRNRCLFEFARHVKSLHPKATQDELRQLAKQWHEAALPAIGTKDFLTTWFDFNRGFESVRYPAGTTLTQIVGEINMADPIPDHLVTLGYGTHSVHLVRICQRLQEQSGDEPFFLSSRQAAGLLQIDYSDAAKLLRVLRMDGFIQEVSKGAGKKASRYRYVCPE